MSVHTSQPDPQWLSLQQAAHIYGISVDTLRRSISSGDLPAARYGARLIRGPCEGPRPPVPPDPRGRSTVASPLLTAHRSSHAHA